MQIVTDSGTNVNLTDEECKRLHVHVVPLSVTLADKTYREGVDIDAEKFYPLLEASKEMPTTSQPPVGDFVELYRSLAKVDPQIFSIHMSSGLSGTYNSALTAATMVPEADITVYDTLTLGAPAGWQVEAAARAAAAGWSKERILELVKKISDATEVYYTLKELKYLIHGGRISHMKGLIASLLNIKPMIGVEKVHGTYTQQGQARTFSNAIKGLGDVIARKFPQDATLRMQVVHAQNLEDAQMLKDELSRRFKAIWLPIGELSLVLGAHVGRSMIGIAVAPEEVFKLVPK